MAAAAALLMLLLAGSPRALAHAILVHSTPADKSVIHQRHVSLTLDYNSRIDVARSTLALFGPSGLKISLRMQSSPAPSELKADAANLAAGTYQVRWQVLASDGHITRGQFSFTVDPR